METTDLGQRVENLPRDAVTEIFLIAFGAEISEGQHCDGTNLPVRFLAGMGGGDHGT